jgi:hypothetical protein
MLFCEAFRGVQRRAIRKMLLHGLGARPAEFNRPGLTKEKKFRA